MNQIVPPKVGEDEPTPIEDRILHLLKIYPIISPSMLQIGIGTSLPSTLWKPCYHKLLDLGLIKEDVFVTTSATGRAQTYTLISLKDTSVSHLSLTPTQPSIK